MLMPDTPDISAYLQIHAAMRRSNERIAAALSSLDDAAADRPRARALARWFDGYAGELRGHHTVEDDLFFPALAERVPTYADHADTLTADHHRLDEVIDGLAAALWRLAGTADWAATRVEALGLAVELRDHLAEHLDLEDQDIVPLFARHFTAAEYEALDKQAIKHMKPKQLLFTVPWLASNVTEEELAKLLADAPAPIRWIYKATKNGYAKKTAAALAPTPATNWV